jgi:vacuolar-type H+-ATPase subunit H
MANDAADDNALTTEEAMNMALKAERDAAEAIAECENVAGRMLEEARYTAHRISERATARMNAVNTCINKGVSDALVRLQDESRQAETAGSNHVVDEKLLQSVVSELAEILTTAADDSTTGDQDG